MLTFVFGDTGGFAGEIQAICVPGIENEIKFVALK